MAVISNRIWESSVWSSPSYTGSFQRKSLRSILSDFTKRTLEVQSLNNQLNRQSDNMTQADIRRHKVHIDEALESLAEEVVDLNNQLKKIKSAEKVFQQFDASAKSAMLEHRINDVLTQNNIETSALKSRLSESVEDIALTQKLIKKIDS